MADRAYCGARIWLEGNVLSTRTVYDVDLFDTLSLFVTLNGDIYIDTGIAINNRIDQWALNATSGVTVISLPKSCHGLFVDLNNTLYCSIQDDHEVVKKSLYSNGTSPLNAAGTGSSGWAPNELDTPQGIFVSIGFDLYVADMNNNRIQRFAPDQINGTTVAGDGAMGIMGNISLDQPTSIVLDADGYMFIVDSNHHRIVGSGPNGFRCLVGCTCTSGSQANKLNNPQTLSFDSYGNIFVTDFGNYRIQKFLLSTNYCSKFIDN